ncbi:MAG: TerC family protein [Oceanicaulis sp.]
MDMLVTLASDPAAWAALVTLIIIEVVLGIDNLIFISVITNKLPPAQRATARRVGIALALGMRLTLLFSIAWLAGLTTTVIDLGFSASGGGPGEAGFETAFSWRDIILILGGLFLIWKATSEIHHKIAPEPADIALFPAKAATAGFGAALVQIAVLDMVFSLDSILTAIGMTDHILIMVVAIVITVTVMFFAAGPLARFMEHNPSIVMLALAFLLMIGMVLIADGFGLHVPKGYVYASMGFSIFVQFLNMLKKA